MSEILRAGAPWLRLWLPPSSRRAVDDAGRPIPITDTDIQRITHVTANAWRESTAGLYGAGLLVFHIVCDARGLTEEEQAPVSLTVLQFFVASLAGHYAASTINNYVHGVRAWHILHGLPWHPDQKQLDATVAGAGSLAPTSSKRPPRQPLTVEMLKQLAPQFDLSTPLDAAVWACITFGFFSLVRLGELTVRNQKAFDPAAHPSRQSLKKEQHRDGSWVWSLALPRTKVAANGEQIYVAQQEGAVDPWTALETHLIVNRPTDTSHIFAYTHTRSKRTVPLTRSALLKRLKEAALAASTATVSGHSLRIGGTLEYLLRGISFETVKAIGRWKSDTFTVYLRRHAQVLAPYLQADAAIHAAFTRHTIQLPPPR